MARPRTPTETLATRGAFVAHPERLAARIGEPQGWKELPDPPDYLTAAECAVWREVAETMHKRVTIDADVHAFAIMVRLVCKMRYNFDELKGAEIAQMRGLFNDFGMTPASRSKVKQAPEAKAADPWAEFGKPTKQ